MRYGEKRESIRILITDALILILVLIATNVLSGYLIPYINETYHLSAESIDVGSLNLFSSLFSGSPSSWFTTRIEGYELPQYKWYIALAVAWMIQTIANDISSYLRYQQISIGPRFRNFAVSTIVLSFIVSAVFSAFMMQMTNFFIITVCPQNIPVLFMIGEIILFCLPALIHMIIRRFFGRRSADRTGIVLQTAPQIVNILLLFMLTKSDSGFLHFLLLAVNFASALLESRSEDPERTPLYSHIIRLAAVIVTGAWMCAGIAFIRPVVYTHMPTVEHTQEDIYCSDITCGENRYRMLLRTDGCAIDSGNNVLGEDIMQILVCGYNAFMLSNDHVLYVTDGKNTIPTAVKDRIVWICCFSDTLMAIDEDGNVLGFGDYGNYLPGEPCYDDFEVIASGYNFVSGDIGEEHILLVDADGNLYSMGCNSVGELGTGTSSLDPQGLTQIMSGVTSAKAGRGTSFALTTDGRIYAWGRNDMRQLGFESTQARFSPEEMPYFDAAITQIAVGAECGFALDENGNLWAWGNGLTNKTDAKPEIRTHGVLKISDYKYRQGSNSQYLYMIDEDNNARSVEMGSYDTYDIEKTEVIVDTSDWMPEPIEEINSSLEDLLGRLNIAVNDEEEDAEEEAEEEPAQSALYIPGNEKHAAYWYRTFNGHRYRIYDELMRQEDAEKYCEAMGGHLVTITTEEELSFVSDILTEKNYAATMSKYGSYHIGLSYDGHFEWVTGEDTSLIRSMHDEPAMKEDGEGFIQPSSKRANMNVGAPQALAFVCEWEY